MRSLFRNLVGLEPDERATRGDLFLILLGIFMVAVGILGFLFLFGWTVLYLAIEHTIGFAVFLGIVALAVGSFELLFRAMNKGLPHE